MKRPRRNHSAKFKATVAFAAVRGERTLVELSRQYKGHPNQVQAMDATYIPMRRGFVHLTAVVDWASRRVLSWRLSISLAADAAVEALQEAITRYGTPAIMNTDQGSQFTATDFIGVLQERGIRISMDGKCSCRDNVFVERLCKTIKYEHVDLHAYDGVSEARESGRPRHVFWIRPIGSGSVPPGRSIRSLLHFQPKEQHASDCNAQRHRTCTG